MHYSGNVAQRILTPNIILVSRPKPSSFKVNKDLANSANIYAHTSTQNSFFLIIIALMSLKRKKAILPFVFYFI